MTWQGTLWQLVFLYIDPSGLVCRGLHAAAKEEIRLAKEAEKQRIVLVGGSCAWILKMHLTAMQECM